MFLITNINLVYLKSGSSECPPDLLPVYTKSWTKLVNKAAIVPHSLAHN